MNEMISYGGGVNSVAMTVLLVREGWRGPIVFADTGAEWPDTLCYNKTMDEWLAQFGLNITTVKRDDATEYAQHDGLYGYLWYRAMVIFPAVRFCTQQYKIAPINQWRAAHGDPVELLGIAADESHRKPEARRPLVERNITREGCYKIIAAEGLPVPHKSSCYICPFQRLAQWRELWQRYPELFAKARALEERASDKRTERNGPGEYTISPIGMSLRMIEYGFRNELTLFDDATMAGMERYQPCQCTL